jgi:hypothetical protein
VFISARFTLQLTQAEKSFIITSSQFSVMAFLGHSTIAIAFGLSTKSSYSYAPYANSVEKDVENVSVFMQHLLLFLFFLHV